MDRTCDRCNNLDCHTGDCKKSNGEGYENVNVALHGCLLKNMAWWEPKVEEMKSKAA